MRLRIVRAVAAVTFREFWRNQEAVFWTYGFPILMTVVLGFAFQPRAPEPVPIVVVAGEHADDLAASLRRSERLDVRILDGEAADQAMARGRVALLVRYEAGQPILRADPVRPEAELARLLVERALHGESAAPVASEVEDRPGSRYIDFLIPGLIGLNLLGAGMWGIGFNLVNMRTQKLLRRLFVTPIGHGEFLLGFLTGRGVLAIPEACAIALFGILLWGVPFRGSMLAAVLVVLAGGFAFTGLGCLLASRVRTIEAVVGLSNVCQLPMWLLGGVFFDNERFDGVLRWAVELMPLTHVNRALRDVMLEPNGVLDVWMPIAGLTGFGCVCLLLALRIFRWT